MTADTQASANGSLDGGDESFEAALEQLHEIVTRLESDELSLDETITLFNRGSVLADRCLAMIDAAELTIAVLPSDPGSAPGNQ